ncbi:MAG TPA: AMP-binding protein [Candidatus Limnocylindria bacterium]|nr:AMP-binding protein [Candidatus Limnocylindria bacterium]
MTFLENIFERLQQAASAPVLREIHDGKLVSVTGGEFLAMVQQARNFLLARGMKKGDRCALLAPNSLRWAALDLAMMAEGIIVVPLYARQAPAELVGMMKDSTPARIYCSNAALAAEIQKIWPAAPKISLLDGIFTGETSAPTPPLHHMDSDAVTMIYTSGTSGEPKGVVLKAANVDHMLGCTNARLDQLMGAATNSHQEPDRVFHYLPFCFAGSWILMLTALSRNSVLTLSTDLSKLSEELKLASPDYFLNVPTLLERVRARIEETVKQRGGFAAGIFARAQRAYAQIHAPGAKPSVSFSLWLANAVMFPAIRKGIGPQLKALICGSAPLSIDTQLFFRMLGIPVLQVYGLTETTAICTMDDPHQVVPGRVGPAIPGIEMTLAETGEILVRGPNIFPGYWQRPQETAKALQGGWFHTGDQGEVDANGNWSITGRIKNLIILNSGHNVAPEPLEEAIAKNLPEAEQVVLLGNQRGFLAALVTVGSSNGLSPARIQAAIDAVNGTQPHYKQIRAFHLVPEAFSIENGLLTANGKLKRDAIAARFAAEIEQLFQKKSA